MRNNAGLVALFTVLVAVVGVSTLPRGGSERTSTPQTTKASKAAVSSKSNKEPGKPSTSTACEEIARRLQVFLYPKSFRQIGAESCVPAGPMLPPDVRFVVATVPSPVSTHLALFFDRAIDTIQQAAEDENYSYDSSWFPWNEVSKEYPLFLDQRTAEDEQHAADQQPGLMVFRRSIEPEGRSPYESGLIVLLVAETPTGGIDRTQLRNALGLVQTLGGLRAPAQLKVLGPMFSGSLPSLDQVLQPIKQQEKGPRLTVFSGSVSSGTAQKWFAGRIKPQGTFLTAMAADGAMLENFMSYLHQRGYGRGCVAIISEDETAFGNQPGYSNSGSPADDKQNRCDLLGQNPKPIYLYYPRDIATLRSAYERQSIFNTKRQTPDASSPSTSLRSDLSEPENSNHDTVRSYAGQLTPLAQEAILQNISSVLKQKAIQFVVIRSTSSLDQVFLAQFFRRANPEARVVLDGSDLLFKRGAEGASLRGVMVLSTYPLLTPWQQDWTVALRYPKNGSYRVFGEDVAEGLYIAARELIWERRQQLDKPCESNANPLSNLTGPWRTEDSADQPGVPINDYGSPLWPGLQNPNSHQPRAAAWLSVIGHRQFWPMAFLDPRMDPNPDARADANADPPMAAPSCPGRELAYPADEIVHSPFRFTIELILLFALGLVWVACHLAWCWRGSILPGASSFRLMQFSPLNRPQHAGLIALGSLLPASLAVVTAAAGGFFAFNSLRKDFFAGWFVAMLGMSILASLRNYSLPVSCTTGRSSKWAGVWHASAGGTAVLCLIALAVLQLYFVSELTPNYEIPTYWRAIHLVNGVSPLTPQILLLVGLYLWFWYALRGLSLFGPDRPALPADSSLPALMQIFGHSHAVKCIEHAAIPATRQYFVRLGCAILATIVALAFCMESFALRTLGERAFGAFMFMWFALCIGIILTDVLQLWATWRRLLQLLQLLDRLPLRRTLASLKGLTWSSVWTMSSNVLEERYCLISRQMESLTHLRNSVRQSKELSRKTKVETLKRIAACRRKGLVFAKWYSNLLTSGTDEKTLDSPDVSMRALSSYQKSLAQTAAYVLITVLIPAWRRETKSLIFHAAERSGSSEQTNSPSDNEQTMAGLSPAPETEMPHYVIAAEEFFVLPYVGFIQNMMGRIRTIVLGSLCLFVAVTLAASSYPFDPLPVLGGIFLTLFVIAGGTSMIVLAQMHRDATLSYITNSAPGKLGSQFWIHLITFGIGPLVGLLTTLFPSITDFVSSWLQPSMQALQ